MANAHADVLPHLEEELYLDFLQLAEHAAVGFEFHKDRHTIPKNNNAIGYSTLRRRSEFISLTTKGSNMTNKVRFNFFLPLVEHFSLHNPSSL